MPLDIFQHFVQKTSRQPAAAGHTADRFTAMHPGKDATGRPMRQTGSWYAWFPQPRQKETGITGAVVPHAFLCRYLPEKAIFAVLKKGGCTPLPRTGRKGYGEPNK
jgi:hypothetical protein